MFKILIISCLFALSSGAPNLLTGYLPPNLESHSLGGHHASSSATAIATSESSTNAQDDEQAIEASGYAVATQGIPVTQSGIASVDNSPKPFKFGYSVNEGSVDIQSSGSQDASGVQTGSYKVALPDGRTQIVTYTADPVKGYDAQVSYEGVAQYPTQSQSSASAYANIPVLPRAPAVDESPKPYSYDYSVSQGATQFKKTEAQSQQGIVTGSYQVSLPDTRVQTVTYNADAASGFNADVQYQGTPQFQVPAIATADVAGGSFGSASSSGAAYGAGAAASVEDESPKPFSYQYKVSEGQTQFDKFENQDALGSVSGSYKVHLPDSRVQTVSYNADAVNGFTANVHYQGQAVYPPVSGQLNAGAAYGPRAAYGASVAVDESPKPFSYQYDVNEGQTKFSKVENQDVSGSVSGSYKVDLPDSRVQTVSYSANPAKGYTANVQYEGEAQFPPTPVRATAAAHASSSAAALGQGSLGAAVSQVQTQGPLSSYSLPSYGKHL